MRRWLALEPHEALSYPRRCREFGATCISRCAWAYTCLCTGLKGHRRRWPRSRAAGCLPWIVLLIVILIVLSVLFGGFQKGTKASPRGPGFMIVNSSGQTAPKLLTTMVASAEA